MIVIIDIPLLMDKLAIDDGLLRVLPSAVGLGAGGFYGIVRTSSSLRFTLLSSIYRLFRITRIGRLAGYISHNTRILIATPPSHPRKAVYVLHHHIYHSVITFVLLVLLSVAIIDIPSSLSSQEVNTRYLPLTMIHSLSLSNERLSLSQAYVSYHTQSKLDDLLYLSINGTSNEPIYASTSTLIGDLRDMEMDHIWIGSSENVRSIVAIFSLRYDVMVLSASNLALTIVIGIGMVVWHWWSWRLSEWLLSMPLDQLTLIIRRFAGTICLLSTHHTGAGGTGSLSQPSTPRGRARTNSSFGHSPFPSFGGGGSFGGTNVTPGPTSSTALSEVERQVVEGAVVEMTTVFKVNTLGEIDRVKARKQANKRKKSNAHTPTPRRTPKGGKTPRTGSTDSNANTTNINNNTSNNNNNGGSKNDGQKSGQRSRATSSIDDGVTARSRGNTTGSGGGGWDGTIQEQEEWDRQMGQLSSLHDLGSMRDLELRRTSSSVAAGRHSTAIAASSGIVNIDTALALSDSHAGSRRDRDRANHVTFSPSSVRYSVTDGNGRDRYLDNDDATSHSAINGLIGSGINGGRSSFISPIKSDMKLCPEIATFDALLHDPPALQHFRSFLQGRSVGPTMLRPSTSGGGKPGLELLLFWQECQAFYHQTIANAVRIFSMFIDTHASTPVCTFHYYFVESRYCLVLPSFHLSFQPPPIFESVD
jgi:hypothetical protein